MSAKHRHFQPSATPIIALKIEKGNGVRWTVGSIISHLDTIDQHMSSRQNPVHLNSCYGYGYRFWRGAYRFPGFEHEAKIHS
jgi:hypothetical protein